MTLSSACPWTQPFFKSWQWLQLKWQKHQMKLMWAYSDRPQQIIFPFDSCFVWCLRMTGFILHWGKTCQALTCNFTLIFWACTQLFIWLIQVPFYFSFYSCAQVGIGMLPVSVATQTAAFGSGPQNSLSLQPFCTYTLKRAILYVHICESTAYVCILLSYKDKGSFCGVPSSATPIDCRSSFLFCAILCMQTTTHIVVKSLLLPPGVCSRACMFIAMT